MNESNLMNTYRRELTIVHGDGCYVYDDDNNEYLDLVGGLATCSIGHANKELLEVITKQANSIITVSNLYYTKEQELLAKRLCEISGMSKCFLSNSGTEAIECAIKLAKKHTGKHGFISTIKGFHGRTMGSLSATWKDDYKKPFYPLIDGFDFVEYGNIDELKNKINKNTAAIILEPIQGESGVLTPPQGYLEEAYKLAKENDVLLIVDEIQTGNGRTGKFFCYQHENFIPDIVTTAKGLANGLPIGVTLSIKGIDFEPGLHGSTFGGNAFCSSSALKVLEIIERMLPDIERKGSYFIEKLKSIKNIKEVRGKGFMIGVGVKDAKNIANKLLNEGILVNFPNDDTLRLLPPYVLTLEQIDFSVSTMRKVIDGEES